MAADHDALAAEYMAALRSYLETRDEAGRSRAYELGHAAVEAEIGLLELAAIHCAAIDQVLGEHSDRDTIAASMAFLTESLSTFDMAQRGFWEAQARAAREHAISVELQRSLLPAEVPTVAGLELAVRYLPAGVGVEAGGDWYDVVELADRRVGLVVGDVMGHGIRQAAVMGQLRLATRAYVLHHGSLDAVVSQVETLLRNLGDLNTATLVLAVVDLRASTLELVNAGHPPPVMLHPCGTAHVVTQGHSRLLGLARPVARPVHGPVGLDPGTCVLLYTDGLLERHERKGEDGLSLLVETVSGFTGSPDELCDRVTHALVDDSPRDDVCLLAGRVAGE